MTRFAVGRHRAGFAKLVSNAIIATSSCRSEMSAKPETTVNFSDRD